MDGVEAKELWESLDAVNLALPQHEREPFHELMRTLVYGGADAQRVAQQWIDQYRPRRVRGAGRNVSD